MQLRRFPYQDMYHEPLYGKYYFKAIMPRPNLINAGLCNAISSGTDVIGQAIDMLCELEMTRFEECQNRNQPVTFTILKISMVYRNC